MAKIYLKKVSNNKRPCAGCFYSHVDCKCSREDDVCVTEQIVFKQVFPEQPPLTKSLENLKKLIRSKEFKELMFQYNEEKLVDKMPIV